MNIKLTPLCLVLGLAALLSACGSMKLANPFGSSPQSRAGVPENATAYECDGGKRFYVRMLNNGNDAWLIYPDHEVNLAKAGDNSHRFSSGVITLLLNGAATTLNDGEKIAYTSCKAQVKK